MSLPFLFVGVWATHFLVCPTTDTLQLRRPGLLNINAVELRPPRHSGHHKSSVNLICFHINMRECVHANTVNIFPSFWPVCAKCGPDRCVMVSSTFVVSISRRQFLVVCKRVTATPFFGCWRRSLEQSALLCWLLCRLLCRLCPSVFQ